MLERLRQSLALRLAVQYALVFALSAGLLFSVLYWFLAEALDQRERQTLEQWADDFAGAHEQAGAAGLSARLDSNTAPDARTIFVRLLGPDNTAVFMKVPPDWIETQLQYLPLPEGFGFMATREIRTVRVPQNAERDYAIASRPLSGGWYLQVGRLMDSRAVLLAPLRQAFALAGAGALFLAVGVGTVLAWRATRPLRQVSMTAWRIIETGDLTARMPPPRGTGELSVLVHQLNTLLDKNAGHVRVLRETLDNLAHDLRTPLTRLRGTAELALRDDGNPNEARSALADCVDESDRVLHLLETLLDISAAEAGALKLKRETIDLRRLTARAADLYREVAEEKGITVTLEQPSLAQLSADAVRLGQAINNLVDNALKYTPPGGRVNLATRVEGDTVVLTVTDTGPGIPSTERAAIFRRLYRGDASRSERGLGLGLSLIKAVVEAHGGTITVGDAPGGGTCFIMRLPQR